MASIELKGVTKSFGSVDVIKGVDLTINDGEFMAFVGPSGCGKTTLLRLIAGLEDVTKGEIHIDGVDVARHAPADRGVAMVFQSYALYPHMTVAANIGFPLKMARQSRTEIDHLVGEVASLLDLTALLDRKPRALSGGQRQRVAIGRALVREPKAFLFDEPLSNLDAALRVQMRLELSRIQRTLGATAVYVTHDQVEAMTMASRVAVFNKGLIEQVGTPMELYATPGNLFVAGFIGSPRMNFMTSAAAAMRGCVTLGVRPEHLIIAETGEWMGQVIFAEHLGSDTFLHVDVPDVGRLCARHRGEIPLDIGSMVALNADASRVHCFDAKGKTISPDRSD